MHFAHSYMPRVSMMLPMCVCVYLTNLYSCNRMHVGDYCIIQSGYLHSGPWLLVPQDNQDSWHIHDRFISFVTDLCKGEIEVMLHHFLKWGVP